MTDRVVPVHYLRPNETVWTPPALLSIDTETRSAMSGDDEVHSLRLWSARYTDRRAGKGERCRDLAADGLTGAGLAHQVHQWTRGRKTVWLYAHNLHFDLSVSDLAGELALIGWEVTDFAVDGPSPFLRIEHAGRHLTVCDSWSWLPVPLADVGAAVGMARSDLPGNDDDDALWLARCRADVAILHTAMLALMAWWDDCELGRWSITGGSSGWNAMRHIPSPRRVLINVDPDQVAHDRLAIYGGRRSAWQAGDLPPGRFAELDLERAYTTVCRDYPLPCERMAEFDSLPLGHPWLQSTRHGVIAEVTIETDTPRWPVRIGGRVWYPVGTFRTVLAGPDITEAARLGCLREVGHGWLHRLGFALAPWARWVLDCQRDDNDAVPPIAKMAARHWGRAVVGKWAQRGFTRIELGAAPSLRWDVTEAWNHTAGVRAVIVDFAGTRWQVTASGQCENTYPAVLAFVESYVRVALGRAISVVGDDAMVCCDTDGMIISVLALQGRFARSERAAAYGRHRQDAADIAISAANKATAPLVLREKSAYHKVTVIGPQHITTDGRRRYAGVPASAALMPDGRLWARLWPKLAWQMRHGRAGTFTRPVAEYRIGGTYAPGWVTASGAVRAVETFVDAGLGNHLQAWPATRWAQAGERLAPEQNRDLARYADA